MESVLNKRNLGEISSGDGEENAETNPIVPTVISESEGVTRETQKIQEYENTSVEQDPQQVNINLEQINKTSTPVKQESEVITHSITSPQSHRSYLHYQRSSCQASRRFWRSYFSNLQ
mmetsp:Transcript_19598/g.19696  ORF Transcript_19598/g.19696 Transcript_19598/m.19696 type:complete len:118 (-) Transcript_19598:360-713(-)